MLNDTYTLFIRVNFLDISTILAIMLFVDIGNILQLRGQFHEKSNGVKHPSTNNEFCTDCAKS